MMMDEHVVEYVSGLPAVKSVTNDRIRYTDEFKRRVAEGYRRGESPVAMFRKAGLGPEVIGYKRIERCVARWRDLAPEGNGKSGGPASPAARRHGVSSRGLAPMGVVLAQEERINALERRLGHVAAVLQGMGVDA